MTTLNQKDKETDGTSNVYIETIGINTHIGVIIFNEILPVQHEKTTAFRGRSDHIAFIIENYDWQFLYSYPL